MLAFAVYLSHQTLVQFPIQTGSAQSAHARLFSILRNGVLENGMVVKTKMVLCTPLLHDIS